MASIGGRTKRYNKKPDHGPGRMLGTCASHGKYCWETKRGARQFTTKQTTTHHVSVYKCDETGLYHVGGVPRSVLRGTITRGEIYG
jgi:hypothetical protein